MKKWEYRREVFVTAGQYTPEAFKYLEQIENSIMKLLNENGLSGWELIAILPIQQTFGVYVFKREITE